MYTALSFPPAGNSARHDASRARDLIIEQLRRGQAALLAFPTVQLCTVGIQSDTGLKNRYACPFDLRATFFLYDSAFTRWTITHFYLTVASNVNRKICIKRKYTAKIGKFI